MKLRFTIDRFDYGAFKRRKSTFDNPRAAIERVLINRRIRTANVLLITMKALANEVAKNLVLAGIGSLTVLDHEAVTEDDLASQFFVAERFVGVNVGLIRAYPRVGS